MIQKIGKVIVQREAYLMYRAQIILIQRKYKQKYDKKKWEIRRLQEQQELRDSDSEMPVLFDQDFENFQGKRKISIELQDLGTEISTIQNEIKELQDKLTQMKAHHAQVSFQAGSLLDNFKYRKVTILQLLAKKQQDNSNLEQLIQKMKQDIQYQLQDIKNFQERELQEQRNKYEQQIQQLQHSIQEEQNKVSKDNQDYLKQLKIKISTLKKHNKKEEAIYQAEFNLQNEKLQSLKASIQEQLAQNSQIQIYNIEILSQDLQNLKQEYEKVVQRKLNIDQDLATANEYIKSLKERLNLFLDTQSIFLSGLDQKDYHNLLDRQLILENDINKYQQMHEKISKKISQLEPLIQTYESKQKILINLMKNVIFPIQNPVLKDMFNDKNFDFNKENE